MEIKSFKPSEHYVKAMVYGRSGSGKTVFWGTSKDCLIASAEDGLLSLNAFVKNVNYVKIESLEDMRTLYIYLKWENKYKTLVIDSITEISDRIKLNIEKKNGGKPMTQAQWGELARGVNEVIMDYKTLSMNVLVIAQELVEKDEDKIVSIMPSLSGQMKTKATYSFDVVGYLYTKEGKTPEGVKTIDRHVMTSMSEKLVTKDRSNVIGDRINITFQDWIDAVQKLDTGVQTVVENISNKNTPQEQPVQVKVELPKPPVAKEEFINPRQTQLIETKHVKQESKEASTVQAESPFTTPEVTTDQPVKESDMVAGVSEIEQQFRAHMNWYKDKLTKDILVMIVNNVKEDLGIVKETKEMTELKRVYEFILEETGL